MIQLTPLPTLLTFSEPTALHPSSSGPNPDLPDFMNRERSKTVADVAKELEEKYELLKIFSMKKHKKEIRAIIIKEIQRAWRGKSSQERAYQLIGEKIRDLWRKFIAKQETGIVTNASLKDKRESFIDTGSYFSSMRVEVS